MLSQSLVFLVILLVRYGEFYIGKYTILIEIFFQVKEIILMIDNIMKVIRNCINKKDERCNELINMMYRRNVTANFDDGGLYF